MLLIPDNGINIIEDYYLEEIAAAKEYEFLLVVAPLKILNRGRRARRNVPVEPVNR